MLIAVLHNIRSLHNVGSIFRTADGAGFSKLYLCGITPAPTDRFDRLEPQFAKVALGAEKFVAWDRVRQITPLLRRLKKEGYIICALEQSARSVNYSSLPKSYLRRSKLCLIVGNEVAGLPPRVLAQADHILEIPMHGGKESLNVSVAFGIGAYALAPRRRRKKF